MTLVFKQKCIEIDSTKIGKFVKKSNKQPLKENPNW